MWRLALFLLVEATVFSEQLPYRVYSTADGLVRNTITRIRRDSRGYLWICTVEGLSLFDGSHFTNYTVDDGLPDRQVNDLLAARDGTYWLATGGGLFLFSPRRALTPGESPNPGFTPIPFAKGSAQSALRVLLEDRHGVIWAGGRNGLYRMAQNSRMLEPATLQAPGGSVLSIYEDGRQRLWIGTTEGLYRVAADSRSADRVHASTGVGAIHMDAGGRLWLGGEGLTHLDVETNPPSVLEHIGKQEWGELFTVSGIREASGGELWIAGFGLARFKPDSPGTADRVRRFELPDEWVQFTNALETDSAGNVWAGVGRMGLLAVSAKGLTGYTQADGLASTRVAGFIASLDRPLLVTIDTEYRWNEFDGSRFVPIAPRLPASIRSMGWGGGRIVQQARDGDWWVASADGLLHYPRSVNPRQLSGVLPKEVLHESAGLPKVILQLFEDSQGNLWAGGINGVARRDGLSGKWHTQLTRDLAGEPRAVETFAEDRTGTVWIGLNDRGLARFRGGKFERLTRAVPRGIQCLFVDSRGRLWIGSSRDGLGRMDHPEAADPEIRLYGAGDGLSSADLFSVGEDLDGRIYVAGGRGVDRLNPETGQVRHFTAADGLRGEPQHVFRDRGGSMWFVSLYGVSRYEPRLDETDPPPQPLFRGIRVSGQRRMVSDLGEASVGGLSLQPGETGLDLELAAVRLRSGEKIRYQYQLNEGQWSAPLDTPVISLAGLAPGRYRVQVRTIDGAGWTSAGSASLEFETTPHFWQRWWFQLAMAAVVVAAAVFFHRARVGRLLELERVRSRIAADLHDDIGAGLSQVAILSEVAHRRAFDGATVQRHTEKIATICRELVDSTSDIVWAVSPRHDSLTDLSQRMREFAGELLTAKEIGFRFDVSPLDGRLRMGADMRRQIYLIFKEAIHNAARHSGATEVLVRLAVESQWLEVSIQDNGRGLAKNGGNGNGMENMRRRAESMGGSFEAEGHAGATRVRVRLPLS